MLWFSQAEITQHKLMHTQRLFQLSLFIMLCLVSYLSVSAVSGSESMQGPHLSHLNSTVPDAHGTTFTVLQVEQDTCTTKRETSQSDARQQVMRQSAEQASSRPNARKYTQASRHTTLLDARGARLGNMPTQI